MSNILGFIIFLLMLVGVFLGALVLARYLSRKKLGSMSFALGISIIFGIVIFIASVLDPQTTNVSIGKKLLEVVPLVLFTFVSTFIALRIKHISKKKQ